MGSAKEALAKNRFLAWIRQRRHGLVFVAVITTAPVLLGPVASVWALSFLMPLLAHKVDRHSAASPVQSFAGLPTALCFSLLTLPRPGRFRCSGFSAKSQIAPYALRR